MQTTGKFLILLATLLTWVKPLHAFDLGLGAGAVEEGDDRHRPASVFNLGFTEAVYMRGYFYGRKQGPYSEQTNVLNLNYKFPMFASKSNFAASLGCSLLLEQISYKAQTEDESDERSDQYNFGMNFGIGYKIPLGNFYINFVWDAQLYLAGQAAVTFVTGRKQLIGALFGVEF